MNPKIQLQARKIHRYFVVVITILSIIMMVTGSFMKFPLLFDLFPIVEYGQVARLHNVTSAFFSISLSVMLVTGIYLYLWPYILKKQLIDKNKFDR